MYFGPHRCLVATSTIPCGLKSLLVANPCAVGAGWIKIRLFCATERRTDEMAMERTTSDGPSADRQTVQDIADKARIPRVRKGSNNGGDP